VYIGSEPKAVITVLLVSDLGGCADDSIGF